MSADLPRLLVATEPPPNAPGGGLAIIRQMLRHWPSEKLCWWSCLPERNEHFDFEVAEHRTALIPARFYPVRKLRLIKSGILRHLWTPWAMQHFRKTVEELKPDVVWVIPHGWSIPPVAGVLPETGIGFHVSVHDYADVRGMTERFGAGCTQQMSRMIEQLYSTATTRDAVCQPMLDDLRQQTGKDGTINRAAVEAEDLQSLAHMETFSDKIHIAYAGSILVEDVFKLFVTALDRIRKQLPHPVSIEFYGDHSYRNRDWFNAEWMNEHGNLPPAELKTELKKCTWGFSPMSLTDDDPRYNRFSFPAKFTSYLATGIPLIVIGHPECSAVKVAKKNSIGFCTSTTSLEELSGQLLAALAEQNPSARYGGAIRRLAEKEFNAEQIRMILYRNFEMCASQSRLKNSGNISKLSKQ